DVEIVDIGIRDGGAGDVFKADAVASRAADVDVVDEDVRSARALDGGEAAGHGDGGDLAARGHRHHVGKRVRAAQGGGGAVVAEGGFKPAFGTAHGKGAAAADEMLAGAEQKGLRQRDLATGQRQRIVAGSGKAAVDG